MCYIVKADTLGQLPSMRVTAREFGGVRDLKLLMATIRRIPAYDRAECYVILYIHLHISFTT